MARLVTTTDSLSTLRCLGWTRFGHCQGLWPTHSRAYPKPNKNSYHGVHLVLHGLINPRHAVHNMHTQCWCCRHSKLCAIMHKSKQPPWLCLLRTQPVLHVLINKPMRGKLPTITHTHSLNVQVICDANMKLLNIVLRWPGASHDSFVWRNSSVGRRLGGEQYGMGMS